MRHPFIARRAGSGTVFVAAILVLGALFIVTLGHDRLSSQALWETERDVDGALALALAENAIEEARHEVGRRVNLPGDPLYRLFREPARTDAAPVRPLGELEVNDLQRGNIHALMRESRYKRFVFEGNAVQADLVSKTSTSGHSFEFGGSLRYRSRVLGYPILRDGGRVTREVEVRQQFKVGLIGLPIPFDRFCLYIHNGARFLGLDSQAPADPWPNANRVLRLTQVDIEGLVEFREYLEQSIRNNTGPAHDPDEHPFDAGTAASLTARLDALPLDVNEKIEEYERLYRPLLMGFPEPETVLLSLASEGREIDLGAVGPNGWGSQEAPRNAAKKRLTADRASLRLASLSAGDIQMLTDDMKALAEADRQVFAAYFYPPYFAGCLTGGKPRVIHSLGQPLEGQTNPDPIGHYANLLQALEASGEAGGGRFFFDVERGNSPGISEAFAAFRKEHDPARGALQGPIHVRNLPGDPLVLTGEIPGRVSLTVDGDVELRDVHPDDAGLLTVICRGTMTVAGDVRAGLLALGKFVEAGAAAPRIRGSLILRRFEGEGRFPGLRSVVASDTRLISSEESKTGEVRIFPDHQLVALSPFLESRLVTRSDR